MKYLNNKHIVLIVLLCGFIGFSQESGRERVKTLKVAYITEQLQLSSEAAQNFWPVYNTHENQIEQLRRKERQRFGGKSADLSSLSDSEATTLLTNHLQLQKQKQALEQEFITDLKKVISDKQIILLLKAEKNFKKRLLHQYRKRKGGR